MDDEGPIEPASRRQRPSDAERESGLADPTVRHRPFAAHGFNFRTDTGAQVHAAGSLEHVKGRRRVHDGCRRFCAAPQGPGDRASRTQFFVAVRSGPICSKPAEPEGAGLRIQGHREPNVVSTRPNAQRILGTPHEAVLPGTARQSTRTARSTVRRLCPRGRSGRGRLGRRSAGGRARCQRWREHTRASEFRFAGLFPNARGSNAGRPGF